VIVFQCSLYKIKLKGWPHSRDAQRNLYHGSPLEATLINPSAVY